ncbi:MAG TPA: MFS transporter [Acidimicrobiales bacterium]|nr:MFS transporter [Acidimicrobiales bacterium]
MVRRTVSSLKVRNFRLYFFGQMVSLSGTWMQSVAQAWLVLKLTGSGTALGLVVALQFLPVLVLGPLGGLVADRCDKRRLLYATQTSAGLLALALGLLVSFDVVRLWMVFVLAGGFGLVNAVDSPARQTFVHEMVGSGELPNAVTLNSVMVNLARAVGPAVAGALIATVGLGPCFLINAGSYLAVLTALRLMRAHELQPTIPQPRAKGQIREGFRYVRATPALSTPLLMMAVIGTLAYEFGVILPLMARFTFHGDAGTYGLMSSCMGVGSVVGGLYAASHRRVGATALALDAVAFGVVLVMAAVAPNLAVELVALFLIGVASIGFLSLGNATLQLTTAPEMRGRVMALWSVAFLGSTPVGGPVVGWIGQNVGPRYGLGVGGLAALAAGGLAYRSLARIGARADTEAQAVAPPAPEPLPPADTAIPPETWPAPPELAIRGAGGDRR